MVKYRDEPPAADLDGVLTPDGAPADERRHAAWGFAVLAMLAVVIVTVMAFLIGPSGGHKHIGLFFPTDSTQPSPTDQSTASASATPSSSARASAHPTHSSATPSPSSTHPTSRPATSPSPTPSSTHPTAPPKSTTPPPSGVVLPGTASLIDAINGYRQQARHGRLPRVSGAESPALAQCTAQASTPPSGRNCTPDGTEGVTPGFYGSEALTVLEHENAWFLSSPSSTITCAVGWSYHAGWSVPYYFAVICTG